MCLAIPAQITAIDESGSEATVTLGGVAKQISLALLDDAEIGDFVLIHVGYALNRISPEEAELTLRLIAEMGGAEMDESMSAREEGAPA